MILNEKKYMLLNITQSIKFGNDIKHNYLQYFAPIHCNCLKIDQTQQIKYLDLITDSGLTLCLLTG